MSMHTVHTSIHMIILHVHTRVCTLVWMPSTQPTSLHAPSLTHVTRMLVHTSSYISICMSTHMSTQVSKNKYSVVLVQSVVGLSWVACAVMPTCTRAHMHAHITIGGSQVACLLHARTHARHARHACTHARHARHGPHTQLQRECSSKSSRLSRRPSFSRQGSGTVGRQPSAGLTRQVSCLYSCLSARMSKHMSTHVSVHVFVHMSIHRWHCRNTAPLLGTADATGHRPCYGL